jgi:hypothetical protein
VSTNNSNKTEVINNSNKTEVTNIYNKVVKCDCKDDDTRDQIVKMLDLSTRDRNQHDPDDYECVCGTCIQEQSDRLDWMISMKNPAEGQLRGIRTDVIGLDDSETGLVWGWKLVPEEGEPALFTGGQWVSLMPLIKGENK